MAHYCSPTYVKRDAGLHGLALNDVRVTASLM